MSTSINPFPGLRPFHVEEERFFFGRERQIKNMIDKLADTRLLAVVGASGSGKSSLVNCGLLPALGRGEMTPVGGAWRVAKFRPGGNPLDNMARALAEDCVLYTGYEGGLPLREIIATNLRMRREGLLQIYKKARLPEHVNLLVVVDQFEELFRFGKQEAKLEKDEYGVSDDAIAFINLLLAVRNQTVCPIYVVLTMRSDFLGDCAQFDGLPEAINEGQFLVPRMTRDERRAAIAGPVKIGRRELAQKIEVNGQIDDHEPVGDGWGQITPVLLTRLVNDVGDNPDQLSILQHALNRTWARWEYEGNKDGPLDLTHYKAIGTMDNALHQHAEKAYLELGNPDDAAETPLNERVNGNAREEEKLQTRKQKICKIIFKALTYEFEGRSIRRPTELGTLCKLADAAEEEVIEVIDVFRRPSRSFLMPPAGDTLTPESVIDISHESLMRVWERLKKWKDEEAESAQMYRRLAERADLYYEEERRASLLRDPELSLALKWRDEHNPTETWAHRYRTGFDKAMAFLSESKAAQDRSIRAKEKERREKEIKRVLDLKRTKKRAQFMAILFGVAMVAAGWALFNWNEAGRAEDNALKALAVADSLKNVAEIAKAEADSAKDVTQIAKVKTDSANWLLSEAYQEAQEEKIKAETSAAAAEIEKLKAERAKAEAESAKDAAERARGVAHEQSQRASRNLATLFEERAGRVIDALVSGQGQVEEYREAWLNALKALQLRQETDDDPTTALGQLLIRETQPRPGGTTAGGAKVNVESGEIVISNPDVDGTLRGVIINSEKADTVDQKRLNFWQRKPGEDKPAEYQYPDPFPSDSGDVGIMSLAFNTLSNRLALGRPYNAITLMRVDSWKHIEVLDSLSAPSVNETMNVTSVAFSADDTWLAWGYEDGTLILWNLENKVERSMSSDHNMLAVQHLAFSPNGKYLVAVDQNGAMKQWDLSKDTLLSLQSNSGIVQTMAFSSDGAFLASGNAKGTTLWKLGQETPIFVGDEGTVFALAFSPDDKYLASGNDDGDIILRDLNGKIEGAYNVDKIASPNSIQNLVFNTEGNLLASGHLDGAITLWAVQAGTFHALASIKRHAASVIQLTFVDGGLTSVAADGSIEETSFQPVLFDEANKLNLGQLLTDPRSSESRSIVNEVAEASLAYWCYGWADDGINLEMARNCGDRREGVAAFVHAAGRFERNPEDGKWIQSVNDQHTRYEEIRRDNDWIYLNEVEHNYQIRLPVQGRRAQHQYQSEKWIDLYETLPELMVETFEEQVSEGTLKLRFQRVPNEGSRVWKHFSDEDTHELVETNRDADWIYLEKKMAPTKGLLERLGFQKNGVELYRLPIRGGMVEYRQNSTWYPLYTVMPRHEIFFTRSSFQQLAGEQPLEWAQYFDNQQALVFKETGRDKDWIFLESAEHNYHVQLPLQGQKVVSGDGENATELYDVTPWNRINDPTILSWEKRKIRYSEISLNGRGKTVEVRPGERVQLDFKWAASVAGEEGYCPGCIIQFYVGIEDVFSECFVSSSMDPVYFRGNFGSVSKGFTAPMRPGIYYVTQDWSLDYSCQPENTKRHTNALEDAIAAIRVLPDLLAEGAALAQRGQIKEAFATFEEAQDQESTLAISSYYWNSLCRWGSLWRYAEDGIWRYAELVLKACNSGIEPTPNSPGIAGIRDSRGVARALTGNLEGAIEDFQFYVNYRITTQEMLDKRRFWISELKAGRNPFDDPATLEALKDE